MRKEVYKTPTTQVYPLQVEGYMLTDSQRQKRIDRFESTLKPFVDGGTEELEDENAE